MINERVCMYTANDLLNEIFEAKVDVKEIIKELIKTDWGGSNEEQGKAVQLMRGLSFSEDPLADKFMDKLNKITSDFDFEDFVREQE